MEFVYRYLEGCAVVYIGITNNLENRIRQHKFDKLGRVVSPRIQYICVENRADAEMLETYLINHFGTGKYYNVAKSNKGPVSFLDSAVGAMNWRDYHPGTPIVQEIFKVSQDTKVVTEYVEVNRGGRSIAQQIRETDAKLQETLDYVESEITLCDRFIESFETMIRAKKNGVTSFSLPGEIGTWRFAEWINVDMLEEALDLEQQRLALFRKWKAEGVPYFSIITGGISRDEFMRECYIWVGKWQAHQERVQQARLEYEGESA